MKKGDKLADIDTPELDQQYAQAKADLANAVANSKLADVTAERYHTLVKQSYVSKQQDDQGTADAAAKAAAVESAQANLSRIDSLVGFKTLVAPFDGVVTQRAIELGQLITAGGTSRQRLVPGRRPASGSHLCAGAAGLYRFSEAGSDSLPSDAAISWPGLRRDAGHDLKRDLA